MWILALLFGCFVGWIYCTAKDNKEKADAAERAKYVRTNESYMQASRDGTKVSMGQLSRREFAKRLDNGYYDTLKEDAWQDEAGGWHKYGVKPVYFHKHADRDEPIRYKE